MIEEGGIKDALSKKLGKPVVAAGQLRQGKAPSMAAMFTGAALIGLLRPRYTKQLPRAFVIAVTADEVFAFRAFGGSDEGSSDYEIRLAGEAETDELLATLAR